MPILKASWREKELKPSGTGQNGSPNTHHLDAGAAAPFQSASMFGEKTNKCSKLEQFRYASFILVPPAGNELHS